MAGPATDADCHAIELIAIALGNKAGGTMLGAIAELAGPMKTRAVPCSAAMPNSTGSVAIPCHVTQRQRQRDQQVDAIGQADDVCVVRTGRRSSPPRASAGTAE